MSFADQLRVESSKSIQKSEINLNAIVKNMFYAAKNECSRAASQGERSIVGFVECTANPSEVGSFCHWEKPEHLLMYIGTPQERAAARKKNQTYYGNGETLLPHWRSEPCRRKGMVHNLSLQDVEWVANSVEQMLRSEGLTVITEIVEFPDLERASHSSLLGENIKTRELPSKYYNIKISVSW